MDLGAVFEDMRVGFGHLGQWARIAVVTDIDWIKRAVDLFKLLLPTQTKLFGLAQDDGRQGMDRKGMNISD